MTRVTRPRGSGVRRAIALLAALAVAGACGSASSNALPDFDTLRCASTQGPTPQPTSVAALVQISSREQAPLHGVIAPAGHGAPRTEPPIAAQGATRTALARELRAAAQVACQLRTTDDAERAGYIMSANFTEGVGTHYTNWRFIDAPFDPTDPQCCSTAPTSARRNSSGSHTGCEPTLRPDRPASPERMITGTGTTACASIDPDCCKTKTSEVRACAAAYI